ncbi:MAG: pilus assembly protein PilY [Proteobacteria bacterium]|nr:pilus assembly protein PilY [Pseudomonadota bacterium]
MRANESARMNAMPSLCNSLRAILPCLALLTACPAVASTTDLSTAPLVTSSSTAVKPNIMFILDDSGSMDWEFIPSGAGYFFGQYLGNYSSSSTSNSIYSIATSSAFYGLYSTQCNSLAYNPGITYSPPVDYQGNSYSSASLSAAWLDGYTKITSVNLGSAFYYAYSGSQTSKTYSNTSSTFYKECASKLGSTPGSSVFTKVAVSALTSAQQINYANWYSYYRSRMLAMKSAAGKAFTALDNRYRVGFMTINNNGGKDLLNIGDFDSTQKSSWFSKLYSASGNSGTPTRYALSVAGRIFANKISSYNSVTVTDPMQYSCQQNFAIMATDGYWNGSAGTKLDGSSAVGNQDYSAARPYYDGSGTVAVVTTITKIVTSTEFYQSCTVGSGRNAKSGTSIVTSSSTATRTVITTSGVVTSDTTTTGNPVSSTTVSCTSSTIRALQSPNPATSTTTSTTTAISGNNITDTMADVAYYYYNTDLRSAANGNATGALSVDVATDNVTGTSKDSASHQHMTTFTLGLGVSGSMTYSPTYETDTSGDYYNVKSGNKNASGSTSTCAWESAGAICNWPIPVTETPTAIDDLWHAAVNGHGTYYSATDPASLATGLSGVLSGISARLGSAAAATTSNPNVTTGDNYVFNSTFVSPSWYGELVRQTIDLTTGTVTNIDSYPCASSVCDWSAQALLDNRTSSSADTRTLYTYDPSNTYGSGKLKPFLWSNLTSAEKTYFNAATISALSQYAGLSTTNQTAAADENLVNFLRGQRGHEGTLYRSRTHILGDIVSSEATYLKAPQFSYTDAGYSTFKSANSSRTAMVYVGANDGMLHAFNAETGAEEWAYIPSLVMPNLYKLADTNYANNHRFYVDGTPAIGDICVSDCTSSSAVWKTILIGGLGGGGRGYYALDITDPASPKALWEFTYDTAKTTGYTSDADMGYSYGNPIITKNADGSWVVLLSSGYNNVSPGTGGGYLFVADAATGSLLTATSGSTSAGKLVTGVGSTGTISGICTTAPCPSGLTRINAWAEDTSTDNTALRAYGGDLFGNLWRFDLNNTLGAAGYDAQHLATFVDAAGTRQPITVKPELGLVNDTYPAVFVGTGKFLGTTDIVDTAQQSFYAIKDPLTATDWGVARNSAITAQTLTTTTDSSGAAIRTATTNAVDWSTKIGWYIDLPSAGERANTDPALVLGTLVFTTNIPGSSACTVGGESWIYQLDYSNGTAVAEDGTAGAWLGNALATRAEIIRLPSGSVVSLTRTSDGKTITTPITTGGSASGIRRIHWRELIAQ